MEPLFIRSLTAVALAVLAGLADAAPARAESLDCLVSRGNLCFSTGCQNSGKQQRLSLDLSAGSYRLCPNRYSDEGCVTAAMQFDIRDTSIVGISKESYDSMVAAGIANPTLTNADVEYLQRVLIYEGN